MTEHQALEGIAVVGLAGRFPEAANVEKFWANLAAGKDCFSEFSVEHIVSEGIPRTVAERPEYVRRGPVIADPAGFDARLFKYSPKEAELIDPQQRILLECAWEALEHAGYDPHRFPGLIGIWAGGGVNNYFLKNIIPRGSFEEIVDSQAVISNDKDYLASRIAYKLNFRGPAVVVQTACSTSLVAVNMACLALLTYQCDMALAGAVFLQTPRARGYLYREGDIFSPDGYCRAFDKSANGIVLGEGCGLVVLRRLEDAVLDGDNILAVIRGSAVNNDGSDRAGYTAPGVPGQIKLIAMAQTVAGVSAEDISYIEAHGTGTQLGDPIEVSALTQVFRRTTKERGVCGLGSVKNNIGHLDVAAGIAGLIKTICALQHRKLPPTINFSEPNPELRLAESPFYVVDKLMDWQPRQGRRIAGVSSFGMGGTNAHVILEEYTGPRTSESSARSWHLLPVSAATSTALNTAAANIAACLKKKADTLADAAWTLSAGRIPLRHRRCVVADSADSAALRLTEPNALYGVDGDADRIRRPIVFLFSGQGTQYPGMGAELYQAEPVFRESMNECSRLLGPVAGNASLIDILYGDDAEIAASIHQTAVSQLALFSFEYAMTRLLESYGVKPSALAGHSIGEYAAAFEAGVFSLEDALSLVRARGQLMQSMPPGTMIALPLPEPEVRDMLPASLDLAVINAPRISVVSGPSQEVERFAEQLEQRGLMFRRLQTSHAFHSRMMEPAAQAFAETVRRVPRQAPQLPLTSNFTGGWMTDEQIHDPASWADHLRHTVRFGDNLLAAAQRFESPILLEVGPGNTLCSIIRQHADAVAGLPAIACARHPNQRVPDQAFFMRALGALWCQGAEIDLSVLYDNEKRIRVPLPAYPFERQHFWIDRKIVDRESLKLELKKNNEAAQDTEERETIEISSRYARPAIGSQYIPPTNDVEKALADIWQDVLGIDKIGIHDSFLDLGGNSLIAVQVISRIHVILYKNLKIQQLFDMPTIAELAKAVDSAQPVSEEHRILTIEKIPKDKVFPLSLSQQRLWFIDKIEPFSPAYNIVQATRIVGKLNKSSLQKSFDSIMARHEVLRTVFKTAEGQAVAELADIRTINIEEVDVDISTGGNGERQARTWVRENAPKLFDLEKAPLIRAFLFKTGYTEHFFVLIMHHIISDGWSMGVWMNELTVLYDALESGKPASLPDLPVQYSDYALWQRKWLEQEDLSVQEQYWKNQLAGKLPVLELPSDYPRPVEADYSGAAECFFLSQQLTKGLKDLSRKEGTSLNIIMFAALIVFLSKYSRQTDIIVGVPYANRDMVETEKLIGFFLNMLPVRAEVSDTDNFITLIKRVHKASFEALANKELPFEQLVKIVQPERSLNYHPLFQVMFAFQNFPIHVIEKSSLTFYPTVFDRGATEYDFALYLWEEGDELHGIFEYSLELFKRDTISRMTGHFSKLVEGMIADPEKPVSRISMLQEEEKKQLLAEWNNTGCEYPDAKCAHQLFEIQAENTPDAIAAVFRDESLTYRELNRRSDQLADYLRRHGAGPDIYVGICIERSINMLIGLLAILKAGGAYVPLDPDYPKERLAYMLESSEAKVLLTQKSLKEELPSSGAIVICIDSEWELLAEEGGGQSSESFESQQLPGPDNLAYVIFTSGSTGKPKGVQITHRCLVNFLKSMEREPGFTSQDVLLAVTTLSFDIAGLELFLPIITGGKTIIASRDVSTDGAQLMDLLSDSGATLMQATPGTWRMLLAAGWKGDKHLKILCGGEAFPKDLAKELTERVGSVWNMYGPTETTVWSTCYRIQDADSPILIGRPIANTQLYILDVTMQPVPVGVYGELYIGGTGVARGYLNRPDLTEKQFLPDPFCDNPSARMYRTGDLVRYHSDGNIEYVGRLDNQVKVRGFRIELGEIESILAQFETVKECAVVAKEIKAGDARLIAFVVYKKGGKPDDSQVREHLRKKLPDYMIPNHFVEVDTMPMTPSGKVDRKYLLNLSIAEKDREDKFGEPENENEKILARIWKEIIGINTISVHDDFFDIGGHSLLALSIMTEVEKSFGIRLPLASLIKAPKIREFSRLLEQWKTDAPTSCLVPFNTEGSKTPFFLLHSHGGNVLEYQPLANLMKNDRPIYAIQHRGLDGSLVEEQTIEELAAYYLKEIRTVQPKGPYLLGGYCLGGYLALEVAQLLRKDDEEVNLLVFINTMTYRFFEYLPETKKIHKIWYALRDRLALEWDSLAGLSLSKKCQRLEGRTKRLFDLMHSEIEILSDHLPAWFPFHIRNHSLVYQFEKIAALNDHAGLRYRPKPYDGKVLLLRAGKQSMGLVPDPMLGWSGLLTGEIHIHEIPGFRQNMLDEPNVLEVARVISESLT